MSDNIVDYLKHKQIECSQQQEQAILSGQSDTLLLAVPGSGKTTVLVSRIAQMLLYENYHQNEIIALSYNRASARDIGRRFESLFGELVPVAPRFSTVHSLCFQILRQYSRAYNRTMPTLLDGSSYALKPQTLLKTALTRQTDGFFTAEQLDDLLARIGQVVNRMQPISQLKKQDCGCQLDQLFTDYVALKNEHHLMDYDDMQTFALQVLTRLPSFRKKITASWKWIFLDEAQDASLLQHEIISILAQGKRVFFVGDEDQTIYDFRGASPKQLLKFPDDHPNAQMLRLETNYRCPKDLVAAADIVIRSNKDRFQKNMVAARSGEHSIAITPLVDYNQQTQTLVDSLKQLSKGKTAAVLASYNVSLLSVAKALTEAGVDYYRRDRDFSFSSCPAVKGFKQLLLYAAAPKDIELFEAAAKLLWFCKVDTQAMKQYLLRFPNGFYAGMVCELSRYEKKHASDTANAISLMQKQNGMQIFDTVMNTLRYANCLAGKGKSEEDLQPAVAIAMYHLREMAQKATNLATFLLLLEQTEAFESQQVQHAYAPITLTTIHGAKGLEFDEVYLLDAVEGCLPSHMDEDASAAEKTENLEAQTRLFYVAATRAKQKFTVYSSFKYWGRTVRCSRFISRLSQGQAGDKQRLKHKAYGVGEILSRDGDTVTVAFENGVRQLMLDYCLQNGIATMLLDEK